MGARNNPRRDKLIENARKVALASESRHLDPGLLFGHASNDDLEAYTPEMLSQSGIHAATELDAWNGTVARVSVSAVEHVEPHGIAVSVLSVTDRNMPFLYDSVMGEVTSTYRDIFLAVHPILMKREDGGFMPFVPEDGHENADAISHIQLHLAPLGAAQAAELVRRVEIVLGQVHVAIADWKPMLSLLDGAVEDLKAFQPGRRKAERYETLAFLEWLRRDNFTFLGMREYIYSGKGAEATVERGRGRGLGILSDPDVLVLRQGKDAVTTTPEILEFLQGPDFIIVTKANVKSVVHRRAYMDYIGIKRFDEHGNVTGELRVVGLFTSTAYTGQASQIPLLRRKIEKIVDHFGFDPASHSGRLLQNTLESYPRDDLFQIDTGLLSGFAEQINDLSDRPRVRVLPRIDHFDRFVSVLVYVPRENYKSAVREKIGSYLTNVYDGRVSAYYPAFPEGGVARVHFIIGRSGGKTPRIPQTRLEEAIREITARWTERFHYLAGEDAPVINVSQAFEEAFTPEETVADLSHITACVTGTPISIVFKPRPDDPKLLTLRLFHADGDLALSRRVPLLEHLGFNVISERTFDIDCTGRTGEERRIVLHAMELEPKSGRTVDLETHRARLTEAFLDAFHGRIDNDTFNRLVLLAGLSAREVVVLRAYARYLRQTGIAYSQNYIGETLAKHPAISAAIVHLFQDRLDPRLSEKVRGKRSGEHRAAIETALAAVPSLDEDRILRRYVNAIEATLRTNYFQREADGAPKPMLAIKLDPHLLDDLPEPRPFREIFVYGVEVEGVHLRFGKVARGGLRWSDRAQDYRTEVLGLVKAQQVKNAVIVPVGAKGGFFPKQLPTGGSRDEVFAAGTAAYKTYIRTLLSITDNIDAAGIVPPKNTVRLDGDDPYFVVAADKGTATFSDTANALAAEAGFWLDDAFASGGSVGYDHKKMGITARGAWEAVKRHFREMDVDIQTTPFTVAGVGDMSGDVFGNGMLLSPKIRLIAAFDHRDIFIDPDPDMTRTLAERHRLFALPRSSWQDFDRAAMSPGGMVISRAEKSVTLTPEAAAAIAIGKTIATPFEIMSAILKAPVDLLWFGGIGTYVKAPGETDAEVGDRANDPIRVSGADVRAKVIGEGANLGVTQRGRIAYSLAGGRCNSDAIDNSAGVNSSDVEVNIKIALASAMRDGRLTRQKRNQLLAAMTDEVAHLVLRNNYLQSLAISLTERKGKSNAQELGLLMNVLEAAGKLNRKVELLPDEASLAERYAAGKPLTRPEIGVLLSYAKIVLFDALIASDLPDDHVLETVLTRYFPAKMQRHHAADIAGHRLRREIVATVLANEVINRGGPGFVVSMTNWSGASAPDVVKAAMLAREGFDFARIWAETDKLDNQVSGRAQNALYAQIGHAFAALTRHLLKDGGSAWNMDEKGQKLASAVKVLKPMLRSIMPTDLAAEIATLESDFVASGIPPALAAEVAEMQARLIVPEIMQICEETGDTLARASEVYMAVTQHFHVGRLLAAAQHVAVSDGYESMALSRAQDEIAAARRTIVTRVLGAHRKEKVPLEAWISAGSDRIVRLSCELSAVSASGEPSVAKMTVAAGVLGDLARA